MAEDTATGETPPSGDQGTHGGQEAQGGQDAHGDQGSTGATGKKIAEAVAGFADEATGTSTGGGAAAKPVQMIKDSAAKITKEAGEKARGYVEDGKVQAGGMLDELAKMMTDAAETVDEKIGAQYGQYARTAAESVTGLSETIKSKNVDELIEDARTLVKKSPGIAIGTAAAIGFVLVRLFSAGLGAVPSAPAPSDKA